MIQRKGLVFRGKRMESFFNWMAENPIRATVIISAVVIALCILLGFAPCQIRKAEKGEGAALEECPHSEDLGFYPFCKAYGTKRQ